jgi:hypothetical protein
LGLPIRGQGTLTVIQLCWYCMRMHVKRQSFLPVVPEPSE